MRLEKIEINGFKSFADRTEIVLDGDITGIVGPNGSGKSNIADAIRWVLGEQNSRNLRGTRMEDFIFGGTQNRKQKSMCEVSLYFNNEDRRINLDYNEIVITRKMYRSGESDFFLNGTNVRLKDILNVVRDTGVGREGYSIVGQGKIDEILSAKPEARRKVFEEAAGVMRFRARKEEAESKLRRTQDNIVRIGDILEELNSQIGPLSEQAEKTRKYQELFERQRFLDINIFLINHERVERRLERLKSDLEELDREIWQDKNRFGNSVEETERLQERLSLIEGELAELRAQYDEQSTAAEQLNSEKSITEERLSNFGREKERLLAETASYEEKKGLLGTQKKENEEKLADILNALAENEQKIARETELSAETARTIADLSGSLEEKRDSYIGLLGKQHNLENLVTEAQVRLEGSETGISELEKRLAYLREQFGSLSEETDKLREKVLGSEEVHSELTEKKDELQRDYNEAVASKNALSRELQDQRTEHEKNVARAEFLKRLQKEYEGYSQGVRNLMNALQKDPASGQGVLGTLAELIEVPGKYEKAIEQALGAQMQNVVVEEDSIAKRCINLLRDRKLGRVSFMPLASLKVRTLSAQEQNYLSAGQVRADKMIGCREDIRKAVEFALARTVIVDDLDMATALARKASYSFRIVTLKGDIITPGGVMTGGSLSERNFGLISRTRDIELSEKAAEQNSGKMKDISAKLAEADKDIDAFSLAVAEINEKIRQNEIESAETRQKLAVLMENEKTSRSEIEEAEGRLSASHMTIENSEKQRESSEKELKILKEQIDAVIKEMDEITDRLARENEDYDRNALSALQIEETRLKAEESREREIIIDIERSMEEQDSLLSDSRRKTREIEDAVSALEAGMGKLSEDMTIKRSGVEELRSRIEKEEAERLVNNEKLQKIQKDGNEFQLRQSEMNESRYKIQNQMDRLSISKEASETKILEDYGLTLGNLEEYREQINFTQGSRELQEIRETIRELGPINPNAIEEYQRTYERVNDLTTQKDDLEKAKADLETLITNILSSMRVVFGEKFESINRYFGEIFTTLFGGGKASISLQEGDIMESGIEIFAEPPGKKIQNISALSGGERALTGIALLFAMIRINPAPICLLDEIDAPLDEANVVRFGNYIQTIPGSQFLIITHRKPTMAICKVLYGVAMEEKGVSKMVSVRVEN